MGMRKAGKRLLKLGQKTAKGLGKEGRLYVEALFAEATDVLERELRKATARKDGQPAKGKRRKGRKASVAPPAVRPRPARPAAGTARKKPKPAWRPRRAVPADDLSTPAPLAEAAEVPAPQGDGGVAGG